MKKAPNATIIASPNGVKGLKKHYGNDYNYKEVKTGETLNIGNRNLNFLLTPMVHWPDNMVTFCPEENILFSNDSFGQHLASSERFDDEYPKNIIFEEAKKYYANIVLPYSSQVQKELQNASKLDIKMIAPSHGIIFKKHISEIIDYYKKWSSNQTDKKSVIIYDTMWSSTKKIAYAIQNGFEKSGYKTRILNLNTNHISDIMTEILNSEYICIGSPTLNNNIMPSVASFLTYLKGLAPKNRKGLAFGSYGWGGQSVPIINKELEDSGFETLEKIKINYIPSKKMLKNIENKIAEQI
ncbi:MAG: FprA family A-type flavoprotein, partial [Candidatus Mcinerneyibacterium aminivorans]